MGDGVIVWHSRPRLCAWKPETLKLKAQIARLRDSAESVVHRLYRARRKLATAGVAVLAAVLAFHVVFGANGMMVYQKKRSEYHDLQNEVQQLQQRNDAISEQIRALKTDPHAIEKEAREQLRYAKPGEVVFLLPAPKSNTPPPNATAEKH